ncbi:hypothetical protein MKZ38_001804, partial [Zalerion maritima]
WPKDYQEDQWKGDNIAVIGCGSSGIQVVPAMQPFVGKMDVYVRSPVWFFVQPSEDGSERPQDYQYTEEEKKRFREHPDEMMAHSKSIENQTMKLFHIMFRHGKAQKAVREKMTARMRKHIRDDRLLQGFTPTWSVGCRRVAPGDPYMEAIQQPNVDVHFTGVASITENGVVGDDGVHRDCNTLVCATGFDVSYRPRFPLVGLNGVDLRDKWAKIPEGYFGLGCPDIPNYITYIGPTWPVENGSVLGPLNAVVDYTIKIIKKMQRENIKSWVPTQAATDMFNDHAQTWVKGSVWEEDCHAWYKDRKSGRVNAVWPGSALHYMEAIAEPRYEDFEIKYHNNKNKYAYLGVGFVPVDLDFSPNANRTPHIDAKFLDPRYYE